MATEVKEITIVCVETRDSHRVSAAKTLAHCMDVFPCREAILFTDKKLDTKALGTNGMSVVHNIRTMDEHVGSYDFFMLSQIASYISTPHYLVVQTNGFILNPEAWNDEFLKYHYVGAPWDHHPMNYCPPHQPVGPHTSVGNGGFSLRSRLLGMTTQGIFHEMSRQPGFVTEHWYPEDCFIARDIRPMLEDKGFRFAPEDLAAKFSCENKIYTDQFGFHGSETLKMNPNINLIL